MIGDIVLFEGNPVRVVGISNEVNGGSCEVSFSPLSHPFVVGNCYADDFEPIQLTPETIKANSVEGSFSVIDILTDCGYEGGTFRGHFSFGNESSIIIIKTRRKTVVEIRNYDDLSLTHEFAIESFSDFQHALILCGLPLTAQSIRNSHPESEEQMQKIIDMGEGKVTSLNGRPKGVVKLIRGSGEKSEDVWKFLKDMGAINAKGFNFDCEDMYYYIDVFGEVDYLEKVEALKLLNEGKCELCDLPNNAYGDISY